MTQASHVKECWEQLDWKIEKVTIVSIDGVAMYPSIKLLLVKNNNPFYTKNLDLCLRLIGFGMSSTHINFQEKYYEYGEEGLLKND